MALVDDLTQLQQLHATGALTDEQFEQAKAALLSPPPQKNPSLQAKIVASATGRGAEEVKIALKRLPLKKAVRFAGYLSLAAVASWLPLTASTLIFYRPAQFDLAAKVMAISILTIAALCAILPIGIAVAAQRGLPVSKISSFSAALAAGLLLVAFPLFVTVVFGTPKSFDMTQSGLSLRFGLPFCLALVVGYCLYTRPVGGASSFLLSTTLSVVLAVILTVQIVYFDFLVFIDENYLLNKLYFLYLHANEIPEAIAALASNILVMLSFPPIILSLTRHCIQFSFENSETHD